MKLKPAITDGAPPALFEAFRSSLFAKRFLEEVVEGTFGVESPEHRPAEYYVQLPDTTIQAEDEVFGVEVRLSGVSQAGRTPKVHHGALKALEQLVADTARVGLKGVDVRVQILVVIMLDGDVPGLPKSPEEAQYGSLLESEARWVSSSDPDDSRD